MAHVVVVGAGTIGSHLLPHLARLPAVSAITIVDPDRYEPSNLTAQNIQLQDVGRPKAVTQADHLARIGGSLMTRALAQRVEDLPLGQLRGDLIMACLDSRRARMTVNQAAWRLGVPWINAGIDGTGQLARVQVFVPSEAAPCLECAWEPRDYELVEQDYACQPAASPTASHASSGLGSLAAALQAIECEKLLAGDRANLLTGRDVMIEARHHRHYVTWFHRNPACRMPDHGGWRISRSDANLETTALAEVAAMARTLCGAGGRVRIAVAGQSFAMALTCGACGARLEAAHVRRGETVRALDPCRGCGGPLSVTGFDLRDAVDLDALPPATFDRSLKDVGVMDGDVLTFTTPDEEVHVEMGGTRWPTES